MLDAAARAARQLGELHSLQDLREETDLDTYLDQGRQACEQVAHHLDRTEGSEPGQWPAHQALHADSRHLIEDVGRTHAQLARIAAGQHRSRR